MVQFPQKSTHVWKCESRMKQMSYRFLISIEEKSLNMHENRQYAITLKKNLLNSVLVNG